MTEEVCLRGQLLEGDNLFLVHGLQDRDQQGLTFIESGQQVVGDILVVSGGISRQVEIVLGLTVVEQDGHRSGVTVDIQKLELGTLDVRHIHVVRGRAQVLVLLVGENVDTNNVALGVTVLSRLGHRDFDDLAGVSLEHAVSVLTEGTSLGGVGQGRSGVTGLEGVIFIRHFEGLGGRTLKSTST